MTRHALWLRLAAIGFAALMFAGLFLTALDNRNAIRDVQQERTARHTQTCEAVAHQVFVNTTDLHSYEQTIGCPIAGIVPAGGGQPVMPTPTP